MTRKIYLCDRMRIDSRVKYDVVMRVRPDVEYRQKIDLSKYDLEELNFSTAESYGIASDIFCFSSPLLMTAYSNFYLNLRKVYNIGVLFNPHDMLKAYLTINHIPYKMHEIKIHIR